MSAQAPPWLTEVPHPVRIFRLILLLAQQLRYLMDQRLAHDGLTTQQAMLLAALDLLGGAPRLGEAAAALAMSHQNVKQLAAVLERKAFLEILVDPDDQRARRLRATSKSRRYWRRRDAHDYQAIASSMAAMPAAELAELAELLTRLTLGVNAAYRAARGA